MGSTAPRASNSMRVLSEAIARTVPVNPRPLKHPGSISAVAQMEVTHPGVSPKMEAAKMEQMDAHEVRAPRGSELSCRSWPQEAAMRMLMNNLDPEVAERPEDLVVYGGTGRAARSWEAYDAIVRTLKGLGDDETLLVQSGKPVGVFRTHEMAPRVLISNAMLVPKWADWETFRELEHAGLTMYGQMTAGSWIYIGTQGILQGTYETLAECATQRFGGTLAGTVTLTGGLGGMGGAQPLAVTMNGGVAICIEIDPDRIERRIKASTSIGRRTRSTKRSRGPRRRRRRENRCPSACSGTAPMCCRPCSHRASGPRS